MKKSSALLTNTSLIFVVVLVAVGIFGLSTVFAATGNELLSEHVDVAATAEAIQLINREAALDESSQQRLRDIEFQIKQINSTIAELRQTQKTESVRQQTQLQAIYQEITQKQTEVDKLVATISTLQQTVQGEEEQFNTQINTLKTQLGKNENNLRRELETAQIELDDIQTESLRIPESTIANHNDNDLSIIHLNDDQPDDSAEPPDSPDSEDDSPNSDENNDHHSGSDGSDDDSHSSSDDSKDDHSSDSSDDSSSDSSNESSSDDSQDSSEDDS